MAQISSHCSEWYTILNVCIVYFWNFPVSTTVETGTRNHGQGVLMYIWLSFAVCSYLSVGSRKWWQISCRSASLAVVAVLFRQCGQLVLLGHPQIYRLYLFSCTQGTSPWLLTDGYEARCQHSRDEWRKNAFTVSSSESFVFTSELHTLLSPPQWLLFPLIQTTFFFLTLSRI